MKMDRAQKEMDRNNQREINGFLRKNEKTIRAGLDSTARAWETETKPIAEKLMNDSRNQRRMAEQQWKKAERAGERGAGEFMKAMNPDDLGFKSIEEPRRP